MQSTGNTQEKFREVVRLLTTSGYQTGDRAKWHDTSVWTYLMSSSQADEQKRENLETIFSFARRGHINFCNMQWKRKNAVRESQSFFAKINERQLQWEGPVVYFEVFHRRICRLLSFMQDKLWRSEVFLLVGLSNIPWCCHLVLQGYIKTLTFSFCRNGKCFPHSEVKRGYVLRVLNRKRFDCYGKQNCDILMSNIDYRLRFKNRKLDCD